MDEKSISQPTMKMKKDNDDNDSFANYVVQELYEHEDDNTTSISSTLPAVSPMMLVMSSSHENRLITNLMSLGDADITVLIIPVEECIPTVSGPVVVEEELCVHINSCWDQTLTTSSSSFQYKEQLVRKYSLENSCKS